MKITNQVEPMTAERIADLLAERVKMMEVIWALAESNGGTLVISQRRLVEATRPNTALEFTPCKLTCCLFIQAMIGDEPVKREASL